MRKIQLNVTLELSSFLSRHECNQCSENEVFFPLLYHLELELSINFRVVKVDYIQRAFDKTMHGS